MAEDRAARAGYGGGIELDTSLGRAYPDKPTELYTDGVGVAPAFQRQGIAGRMLDGMMALGKSLGCEEAWVGTDRQRIRAAALSIGRPALCAF